MVETYIVPEEVSSATNAMLVGEPYHGVRYASLQLSGRGIAKPPDHYGEGVSLARLVTTYWPTGASGVLPETVVTMDMTDSAFCGDDDPVSEDYRRAREIQRQILGMGIADTTLVAAQYPKGTEARIAVDHFALGLSHDEHVPLGGIAISRVVTHNQMHPGDFMASLYFPDNTRYPAFILRALKVALPFNHRG